MKNKLLLLFTLVISLFNVYHSQKNPIELELLGGYTIQDRFIFPNGNGIVKGGGTIKAGLSVHVKNEVSIKLTYLNQFTKINYQTFNPILIENNIPVYIHYVMLGATKGFVVTEKIIPYTNLSAGIFSINERNKRFNTVNFALHLDGGIKYKLTKNIGLNAQIGLSMPIQFSGVSFSIGTGGSGINFGSSSSLTQFSFLGGLSYTFFNEKDDSL
jgi:hypothetical protein